MRKAQESIKKYENPEINTYTNPIKTKKTNYTPEVKKLVQKIIEEEELGCMVDEFSECPDVNWDYISYAYNLSENFAREFSDKLNWYYVFTRQNLSEKFLREMADLGYYRSI